MRPLVYDFGQLNTGTESAYTRQIVTGHVRTNYYVKVLMLLDMILIIILQVKKNDGIPKAYIEPIANVLAYSQQYMRGRQVGVEVHSTSNLHELSHSEHTLQDECSFVSLRDVERAMIVLEYFLDKMAIFNSPMDKMAEKAALENEEVYSSMICQ